MKRLNLKTQILISIFILIANVELNNIGLLYASSTKINSFSPTPIGQYQSIRLLPRSSKPEPCLDGTVFIDSGYNLNLCVNGNAIGPDPFWTRTGTTIHPHETFLNSGVYPYLGLETLDPITQLDISHNSNAVPITSKNYGGIFLERLGAEFAGITSSLQENGTQSGIMFYETDATNRSIYFFTSKPTDSGMQFRFELRTPDRFCLGNTCRLLAEKSTIEVRSQDSSDTYIWMQNETVTNRDTPDNDQGFRVGVDSSGNGEIWNFEDQDINFYIDSKNVLAVETANFGAHLYQASNLNGSKFAVDGPISLSNDLSAYSHLTLESAAGYPIELRPEHTTKGFLIEKTTDPSKYGHLWTENSSSARTGLFIDHSANPDETTLPMITVNSYGVGIKDTRPTAVSGSNKALDIDGLLKYTGSLCHTTTGCLSTPRTSYSIRIENCPSKTECGDANNIAAANFATIPTCTATYYGPLSQEVTYIISTSRTRVKIYNGADVVLRTAMVLCVE